MKTILNENSVERIYSTDVSFVLYNEPEVNFYSRRISLHVTGNDFKVNGVLSPEDWLKSMLDGVMFASVGSDVYRIEGAKCMEVEVADVDYILLTLLRILKSLNTDENIVINSISHETR